MALSKEEILDAVAGMTVLELSELIKMTAVSLVHCAPRPCRRASCAAAR